MIFEELSVWTLDTVVAVLRIVAFDLDSGIVVELELELELAGDKRRK